MIIIIIIIIISPFFQTSVSSLKASHFEMEIYAETSPSILGKAPHLLKHCCGNKCQKGKPVVAVMFNFSQKTFFAPCERPVTITQRCCVITC